jgi:crossover junction endodeoxyribonuclease RuvC
MVILGVDPGYAIVGYGVVRAQNSHYQPLEHGAIVTKADDIFVRRLEIIYDALAEVLEKWKPDAVSIEKLYFQNNQKTAIGVAEARGVILLAAKKAGVPIFEYTPLQVKMAVTGYGQAHKPQVMEMTRRLLCLKEVPKPDDTADALAMAICHGQAAGSVLRRTMLTNRMIPRQGTIPKGGK